MFEGFCAISGSPVTPVNNKRYHLTLDQVGGGQRSGLMYHCCWPCVCDAHDFAKVDTKSVTTKEGVERQYHFAVIGNPCDDSSKLTEPFLDPFSGAKRTLSGSAPEVKCTADCNLEGAHVSDHGYIIIGMFFD